MIGCRVVEIVGQLVKWSLLKWFFFPCSAPVVWGPGPDTRGL